MTTRFRVFAVYLVVMACPVGAWAQDAATPPATETSQVPVVTPAVQAPPVVVQTPSVTVQTPAPAAPVGETFKPPHDAITGKEVTKPGESYDPLKDKKKEEESLRDRVRAKMED